MGLVLVAVLVLGELTIDNQLMIPIPTCGIGEHEHKKPDTRKTKPAAQHQKKNSTNQTHTPQGIRCPHPQQPPMILYGSVLVGVLLGCGFLLGCFGFWGFCVRLSAPLAFRRVRCGLVWLFMVVLFDTPYLDGMGYLIVYIVYIVYTVCGWG